MANTFVDYDTVQRGDDFYKQVRILYKDAPANITGFDFRFTLKRTTADSDGEAVFQLTVGDGIEIEDEAEGLVGLSAPWDTMTTIPPGIYIGDLQMTTDTGKYLAPCIVQEAPRHQRIQVCPGLQL